MIDVSEEAGGRMDVDADGGEGPAGVEQPGEEEGGADHPAESKKVTAKFLVSNPAAGSIIGRAGSNISQLQQQSGARLQLSRSGDYFAGTQDRIMLATGTVNQILTALHLVLTKVKDEQASSHIRQSDSSYFNMSPWCCDEWLRRSHGLCGAVR